MSEISVQRQLYRTFCNRRPGMLEDDTLLSSLRYVLGLKRPLRTADDLLDLSDEEAKRALDLLKQQGFDIPRDPRLTLQLVA